jgi:hypothetical protein
VDDRREVTPATAAGLCQRLNLGLISSRCRWPPRTRIAFPSAPVAVQLPPRRAGSRRPRTGSPDQVPGFRRRTEPGTGSPWCSARAWKRALSMSRSISSASASTKRNALDIAQRSAPSSPEARSRRSECRPGRLPGPVHVVHHHRRGHRRHASASEVGASTDGARVRPAGRRRGRGTSADPRRRSSRRARRP